MRDPVVPETLVIRDGAAWGAVQGGCGLAAFVEAIEILSRSPRPIRTPHR